MAISWYLVTYSVKKQNLLKLVMAGCAYSIKSSSLEFLQQTPVSIRENRAAEELKFSFKDFCREYEQSLRICSNLQKNSWKGNIFCTLKYPKDPN